MLAAIGVGLRRRAVRRQIPEGVRLGRDARPARRACPSRTSSTTCASWPRATSSADDEVSLPRRAGCTTTTCRRSIDMLMERSEFLTPYTPYQPEISQGGLQVMFEYQTAI